MFILKKYIKAFDFPLFSVVIILVLIGLMMVYSASSTYAALTYGSATYFIQRQLFWVGLGFIAFFITSLIPYQFYGKYMKPLVLIMLFLLTIVLIPGLGIERNHATRWLGFGSFIFQPSELAKIMTILYVAKAYSNKQSYIQDFKRGVMPPLLLLIMVFALIVLQPDLGTAMTIVMACGSILLISSARWQHLVTLGAIAITSVILLATTESYRMERLTSFIDPFADASGQGFQVVNSYLAIGTGGLTGNGIGNSVQKLGYLPEAHTDFIMAIIVEELGIIGLGVIITLFLAFLFRGFSILKGTNDYFAKFIAIGIIIQISSQAVMNLGAVSGLLPVTGMPLPLVSYGGSSMLITLCGAGILMNISMQNRAKISDR